MATTLFDQEESTFPFAGADVDSELDEDADYYQINYDLDDRGDEIGGSSSTMTPPAPLPPLANQPAQPQKTSIVERVVGNAQAVCAREMVSAVMEIVNVAQIASITVVRECKNLKLVVLLNLSGLWNHSHHPCTTVILLFI